MYGIRNLVILFCISVGIGCSPVHRFNRLVTKYPFLLDSVRKTEIIVREGIHTDTSFVWKNTFDTIFFPQATIERRNDTFRFYFRERNCTTYIESTQIIPSKTIERYYKEKSQKESKSWIERFWYYLVILLLSLLILFKKS